MMRIDVFTIFPELLLPYLTTSILARAQMNGQLAIGLHQLRDYTTDRHRTTDDVPYGGGGGMLMKPEPVFCAVESVLQEQLASVPILLMTPQGEVLRQSLAQELAGWPRLAVICGRYEGVDERIRKHLVTREISIGDYVLTGGEVPALVLIDSVIRLLPGVLGDEDGAADDSHASGLLEYPHYTRPPLYRGWEVPPTLTSGDHARIAAWRRAQSLQRTLERRPDLLATAPLSKEDRAWIQRQQGQEANPGEHGSSGRQQAAKSPEDGE
jgi:tRNA (guanine37-N1)-methyltransferase